jgi:hypothetical protein
MQLMRLAVLSGRCPMICIVHPRPPAHRAGDPRIALMMPQNHFRAFWGQAYKLHMQGPLKYLRRVSRALQHAPRPSPASFGRIIGAMKVHRTSKAASLGRPSARTITRSADRAGLRKEGPLHPTPSPGRVVGVGGGILASLSLMD